MKQNQLLLNENKETLLTHTHTLTLTHTDTHIHTLVTNSTHSHNKHYFWYPQHHINRCIFLPLHTTYTYDLDTYTHTHIHTYIHTYIYTLKNSSKGKT